MRWQRLMGVSTLRKRRWQRLMGVSALLVLVLSGIWRHVPPPFGILRSMRNGRSHHKNEQGWDQVRRSARLYMHMMSLIQSSIGSANYVQCVCLFAGKYWRVVQSGWQITLSMPHKNYFEGNIQCLGSRVCYSVTHYRLTWWGKSLCRFYILGVAIGYNSLNNRWSTFYSEGIWQPLLRTSNTNEGTKLCLTRRTKWAKLKYFASAEHRKEGGWYLALDAGDGTTKNAYPYQNKFGEKTQNMSGIVTTAEY